MTAAALPIVGLMLCAQEVLQPEGLDLRRQRALPEDHWYVLCARVDSRRAEKHLRATVAANDEAPASPAQA